MRSLFWRAVALYGGLLVYLSWLTSGATWREALDLTRYGIRPILGGAAGDPWAPGGASAAGSGTTTVTRWAREVWVEMPKLIYWSKFMSDDLNSIIQRKKDLEANPGDKIFFSFIRKLTPGVAGGFGATGDTTLEGKESSPATYTDDVIIDQKRNAVKVATMAERRTAFDQRDTARQLLSTWIAETIDADIFTAFAVNPSNVMYGGAATSLATLSAGDTMTTALLTKAKTRAKKGPGGNWKVWPVQIGGAEYYVCVVHPDQEHDLKVFDAAWAQAQREAQLRGPENPIFRGALGVWDGVIIHSHENISTFSNGGGGTLEGARAMFLGRQAMAFAWGKRPFWVEKEFDYGAQTGFASGAIWGQKKAVFNSIDNAYAEIVTARTNA